MWYGLGGFLNGARGCSVRGSTVSAESGTASGDCVRPLHQALRQVIVRHCVRHCVRALRQGTASGDCVRQLRQVTASGHCVRSLREADAADEVGVARIGAQAVERGIHFEAYKLRRVLLISFFEPSECVVVVAQSRVVRGDRERGI
jgi:hypothetical protein